MIRAKKVIITGGSRGIGAAAVRLFTDKGYSVAYTYNNASDCAQMLCEQTGAISVRADFCDADQTRMAIDKAVNLLGGVDILINNAGISSFGLITDVDEAEWSRVMNVNLGAVYRCIQQVLPIMISQKSGRIVNVSSMWGIAGSSCESVYSASKAAVIGLTKSLAKELGPSGITVNCIAPGVINTDMNKCLDNDTIAELKDNTPLERLGRPEDVANAMFYLCSEGASFVTGQILSVDGGFIM